MQQGVPVSEALYKSFVDRRLEDGFAGQHVTENKLFRICCQPLHIFEHAKGLECLEGVWRHLDSCADLAKFRSLFQNLYCVALIGERERGRDAANSTSDDNDGQSRVLFSVV